MNWLFSIECIAQNSFSVKPLTWSVVRGICIYQGCIFLIHCQGFLIARVTEAATRVWACAHKYTTSSSQIHLIELVLHCVYVWTHMCRTDVPKRHTIHRVIACVYVWTHICRTEVTQMRLVHRVIACLCVGWLRVHPCIHLPCTGLNVCLGTEVPKGEHRTIRNTEPACTYCNHHTNSNEVVSSTCTWRNGKHRTHVYFWENTSPM